MPLLKVKLKLKVNQHAVMFIQLGVVDGRFL